MISSILKSTDPIRSKRLTAAILWLLALCAGLFLSAAAAEAYTLQKGDTLALSVVGAPEIQSVMTVDIDGNVTAPLVGPVPAVGRTLQEVGDELRGALSQVSYTAMSGGGELVTLQILPPAVTLSIASYRPVYVNGDVLSPGAFDFAPGLTARRAVALAGGYGLARLLGGDPAPELFTLQGDRRRLQAERVAVEVRIQRVRAQLAGESAGGAVTGGAPSGTPAASLAETEQRRLDIDRQLEQRLMAHYDTTLAMTRKQIETLQERLRSETEGVAADTKDFNRLLDAQTRGAVSAARLSDGRRTLLFSTTRELQTKSELDRAEMELEVLSHGRNQGRIDRRAGHLAELSEAMLALETISAELASTERRMAYFRGAVVNPDSGADATIMITHPDSARRTLEPGEDPTLEPGDLVSVRVNLPEFAD